MAIGMVMDCFFREMILFHEFVETVVAEGVTASKSDGFLKDIGTESAGE